MAANISTQNYQYFIMSLNIAVSLRPFIQLKRGSCTLLEWHKWRTCSLGSRFLRNLLEAGFSTWLFLQSKTPRVIQGQTGSKKKRILQLFSPRASGLHWSICCCISQCAANTQQHARCGQEPQPSITLRHFLTPTVALKSWICMAACLFWAYKCLS